MKIKSVLYYRYFFRQSLVLFFVVLILVLSVNLVVFFVRNLNKNLLIEIMTWLLWIFPFYLLILSAFFFINFLKCKKEIKDLEFYAMFTNASIRNRIIKSGLKLNILFPKKNQEKLFFEVIQLEIDKQKKLLSIKKGTFK